MRFANSDYNIYVMAIETGTSAAFLLYGWIGSGLINLLADKLFILNWGVGLTLFLTAVFQVKKVVRKNKKPVLVKMGNEI
jgi:hypothetical protein